LATLLGQPAYAESGKHDATTHIDTAATAALAAEVEKGLSDEEVQRLLKTGAGDPETLKKNLDGAIQDLEWLRNQLGKPPQY
jgi:hypothetical protein